MGDKRWDWIWDSRWEGMEWDEMGWEMGLEMEREGRWDWMRYEIGDGMGVMGWDRR